MPRQVARLSSTGKLHHIELYVSDLKRSVQFWGWFLRRLGYRGYQRWDSGRSWKLGATYIVVVQVRPKYVDVSYHRCRVGLNHLAFHASSKNQVDAITEELKKRSIQILYEDRHPYAGGKKQYAVYFEDPDRIKIELVAP